MEFPAKAGKLSSFAKLNYGSFRRRRKLKNDNMVKRIRVHRWMPRSREAKKAVISCEKLGEGANIL